MTRLQGFLFLLMGFTLIPAGFADQIALKNGDQVTGKIVTGDDKTITVKSEFMGEVKIDRAAITSIKTDQDLNVALKDGKTVKGKLEATADTVKVESAAAAPVSAPVAEVTALRDEASQRAWEREQERLTHPKLRDFWTGFVTLSLANSSGNAKTTTLGTAAQAVREAGKYKVALNFSQIYSKQSTTEPFGVTADKISAGFRIDRNLNNKVFAFATNNYDYDQFLDLDLRSQLGGGLGYHIWKTDKHFWDAGAGGGWTREAYGSGEIRNFGELILYEQSAHSVHARFKLYQRFTVYPNMTDTGEYRFNFDGGASVPLFKWLEWSLGFTDSFLSNPPAGKLRNDSIFSTGVRVSFDQSKK